MKKSFFILLLFLYSQLSFGQENIAYLVKNNLLSETDTNLATPVTEDTEQKTLPPTEAPTSVSDPKVRPFITDDARVVGNKLAQLETWFRRDRESTQQWVMMAYGPNDKLEVSLGGVFGTESDESQGPSFGYALPLLQAKLLFRGYAPGKGPGFGLVTGTFLPAGKGAFKPRGYGSFGFLTVSQCFGQKEDVLLHLNTGLNYLHIDKANEVIGTWGFGTQVRTFSGFHLVGEIFSGDPYVPGAGMSYQTGFRHFFSDLFQVDMTIGKGIAGENPLPFWYSAGARIVFTKFAKK